MKNEIKLITFIGIRYADPISSIDLTDDFLLFGSMLGATNYYIINQEKLKILSEIQDEYISGVKIHNNKLYICIGDFKIIIYHANNNNDNEQIPEYIQINNYNDEEGEEKHLKYCEKCLTMLNDGYLIRTFIDFPEKPEDPPIIKEMKFSIKNILQENDDNDNDDENKEINGEIKMSNYSVPFDFDGNNYIYIDFIEQNKRSFNVYDVNSKNGTNFIIEEKFKNENFGHISHLKVIKKDVLFLVRNYNICEIRNYELKIIKKLNIKSNEILAFDVLFDDNENNIKDDNNINNENNINNVTNETREANEDKDDKEKKLLYIAILDIDCNIFLYNYKEDSCKLLFNLENDDIGIDKDIKGQKFFLFGYPYFIKLTKKYIAITSDYGCILVQYSSF